MIQEPFSYGQLERTGFSFDPSNPFVPISSKLKNSSEIKVCLTRGLDAGSAADDIEILPEAGDSFFMSPSFTGGRPPTLLILPDDF